MKTAVHIVRILLGLLFLAASVTYFLDLVPVPEMEGDLLVFSEGLVASGYIFPLIKSIELLCALSFLANRFLPLATVVLFPVTLNILMVNIFLDPSGFPVAVFAMAAQLFLAFVCREHYRALFAPKISFFRQPQTSRVQEGAVADGN